MLLSSVCTVSLSLVSLAHVFALLKKVTHFHGGGALRLNTEDPFLRVAMSAERTHQRLGVAEGVIRELQEQLQRVSARHQAAHEALQAVHQEMSLLRFCVQLSKHSKKATIGRGCRRHFVSVRASRGFCMFLFLFLFFFLESSELEVVSLLL